MKSQRIRTTVVAASAAVAIGLAGAPAAFADDEAGIVTSTTIGQQAELNSGDVVQAWTITGLKPSSDVIPYAPRGTLWEATATNEAVLGSVQPIISNLNARAADGTDYRVLFAVATPQGINPSTLAQGEKATGKVYFDVTDAAPDSVVYNAGGRDLLVWKPAPPAPAATGGTGGGYQAPVQQAPVQTAPSAPAPAATGSTGTPITEATPTAPDAAGSVGTPIAEGAPDALTPAEPAAAPEAGSAGTPLPEGSPAPAAGSVGTPVVEGSTGTPAAVQPAPTPTVVGIPHGQGSSGTPAS